MTQQMSSPILVLADQAGDHLTPLARQAVTLAVANLYLRQQIIFERIST